MIRIYLFLLPKPTKIVLVNCCCNKNSQLCSCADACTFTGFIYSLLHDSGLFSHDFIPFFFSVHTLQSLSLLWCFHLSVSSSLSGPLTFSLIFLIQSLWSLYGADSWQTQLGFPMTDILAPVCMSMLTVSWRCCWEDVVPARSVKKETSPSSWLFPQETCCPFF